MPHTRSQSLLTFLVLSALMLPGCAATGQPGTTRTRGAGDFASRRLPDADIIQVRAVAERVFRQYFRIDPEASSDTVLISRPTEVEGRGRRQNVRDQLTLTPDRQRQIAELRVREEAGVPVVLVSVQGQRLQTTERDTFARNRGDDRPGDTAIQRQGNTSAVPREEWVDMGRDRATEKMILDEIAESLATTRPSSE